MVTNHHVTHRGLNLYRNLYIQEILFQEANYTDSHAETDLYDISQSTKGLMSIQ